MQEPLTVIVIGLISIAVVTTFAFFVFRIKRSRDKVVVNDDPEPAVLPTAKEIDTSTPRVESSASSSETTHRATQTEPSELETSPLVLTNSPILESPLTSVSVPKDGGTRNNQETIPDIEPDTIEPPINQVVDPPTIPPDESTQPPEESTGVLPGVETPVTQVPTATQKQIKLAPDNRGGAPRGKRTKKAQETPLEKTERLKKPELICWQQSRKWFLGVWLPRDFGDTSEAKVTQDGIALKTGGTTSWPISTLFGNVKIECSLASERYEIPIAEPDNPFLLFKLSGQNLTSGRRIRFATTGTYLVVVPDNWTRNEVLSGVAQVPPERCHLDGFSAHFFHLDTEENNRISFIAPGNELIEIPNGKSQFQLVGSKIDDASDEMGALFGLSPPHIRSIDPAGWKNVETIVIGEEGEERSGWRTSFYPEVDTERVDLTPYLVDKDGGWFFVRIYDATQGPPIESLDFRFLRNLQAITIDRHTALPMQTGHKPITVTIKWNNDERGKLLSRHSKPIPTKVEGSTTRIVIPPEPDADKTDWILESPVKTKVDVSLQIERVWWTVCRRNSLSDSLTWHDKPMYLSRSNCTATSEHQLRIRFPRRRWANQVRVGFHRGGARTYRPVVTQQIVDVPLNHFEGVTQLEDFSKDHLLSLWLDDLPEQTIAILPARSQTRNRVCRRQNYPTIRLNLRRLLKYLNRLDRAARDASLSSLLRECRQNWLSSAARDRRETYLLQTACVIIVSWRVIRSKGKKPIGRRKGWIRAILKLAETSPSSLLSTSERYETLRHGTNDFSSN